jgi:hypothetical protein
MKEGRTGGAAQEVECHLEFKPSTAKNCKTTMKEQNLNGNFAYILTV